jgi:hypothetical protein
MRVDQYYKIVIPPQYWTTEFKMNPFVTYGVCNIPCDAIINQRTTPRLPRVYPCGFHLTLTPSVYAPVWSGHKPKWSVVGHLLLVFRNSILPTDVKKYILKYL